MHNKLSGEVQAAVRSARITTAMQGLRPDLVTTLPPEDWPEVLERLQAIYRRVTAQPDAVLALRQIGDDGWRDVDSIPRDGTSVDLLLSSGREVIEAPRCGTWMSRWPDCSSSPTNGRKCASGRPLNLPR
jgi:hypothetical protein